MSRETLAFTLPPLARLRGDAPPPLPAMWWRIGADGVIATGSAADWPGWLLTPGAGEEAPRLVALAPVGDCALYGAELAALAPRQAAVAARLLVADRVAEPVELLHIVPATGVDADPVPVAVVSLAAMRGWLGWCAAAGLTPDSVVPAGLILPTPAASEHDVPPMIEARLGDEIIRRSADSIFVADPALVALLPGAVAAADADLLAAALAAEAAAPRIELLCGPFAPPRAALFDRRLLRRLALWLTLALLLSLGIAVARLVRYQADIARLDGAAAADVASVLRPAPPLDRAIAELDARLARLGGAGGQASAPLAALIAALEPNPAVALDSVSWRSGDALAVTLGATRADEINAVLIALQAAGYRVTAQPRTGADGRALGDITIRSAP